MSFRPYGFKSTLAVSAVTTGLAAITTGGPTQPAAPVAADLARHAVTVLEPSFAQFPIVVVVGATNAEPTFSLGDPAPQFVPQEWIDELNSWGAEDTAPFSITWDED